MIQFWRILAAGSRNFLRNAWLSTAATIIMVVTLTFIVISFISNSALTSTIKGFTDKIDVSIYLKDGLTQQQQDLIRHKIEHTGNAEEIEYISKDAALAKYKTRYRSDPLKLQAVEEAGNTLPASFSVKLKDRNKLDSVLKVSSDPTVKPLLDPQKPASITGARKDDILKIINGSNFIIRLGLIASAIFVVISTLIIFNTIRMAIFTRRDEIEIMKLVGATKWFIRGPFVFEAALYGIIAAIIATVLSYTLLLSTGPKLSTYIDVQSTVEFFRSYPALIVLSQLAIGIFIGAFSSFLALSRYLKL